MIRRPKLRIVSSPTARTMTTTDADREDDLDLRREAVAEAQEPGRQAEDDDREQVEDPLDEDGPERPAQRDRAVDLEQVGPVDVAELGRHEAVDEPADEDDLGRVADLEPEAGPAEEDRPAQAAQREAEVEDERTPRSSSDGFAGRDVAGQLVELEPGQRSSEQHEQDERQDDRDDRPRLAQPAAERQLVGGDLVVGASAAAASRGARARAARARPMASSVGSAAAPAVVAGRRSSVHPAPAASAGPAAPGRCRARAGRAWPRRDQPVRHRMPGR